MRVKRETFEWVVCHWLKRQFIDLGRFYRSFYLFNFLSVEFVNLEFFAILKLMSQTNYVESERGHSHNVTQSAYHLISKYFDSHSHGPN